ncbi:MAG: response regulator, partial [Quisquiliibacterium sp.]
VLGEPRIRFYAGVPIKDRNGLALGSLCVIDRVPRELTDAQRQSLQVLARSIESLLSKPLVPSESNDAGDASDRILVVDDEEELCEIASVWLESLGYRTETAHNAQEALNRLQGSRFGAMLTDVVMPGTTDGLALAREVQRLYPWMKVVLASGYAGALPTDPAEMPAEMLNKPYRKPDLARYFPKV